MVLNQIWRSLAAALAASAGVSLSATAQEQTAAGTVFLDANRNGVRDVGEAGIAGVAVSNGRDVIQSDANGTWHLPVGEDTILFVIKPTDYMTPLSAENLPQFYYIHKPAGSPPLKYPGVAPTGPLPGTIDFALYPQEEPRQFRALIFGDPQPRGIKELDWAVQDVVEELVGIGNVAWGVSLGDIMFDQLDLFETWIEAVAHIGLPWYNVHGNHDMNFDAATDALADESFERVYGPATYAYAYGGVHFVILDNVYYRGDGKGYEGRFTEDQLTFLENYLKTIPKDRLVVFMMHIPLPGCRNLPEFFAVLEGREHLLALAAHTHTQAHLFFGETEGWTGQKPFHHVIQGTVSGSWWCGLFDELGLPHAVMNDGTPNGYAFYTFDGTSYRMEYKAARRPADYQMNIYVPQEIAAASLAETEVAVNVFNGSERSTVEMRVAGGDWGALEHSPRPDPNNMLLHATNAHNPDETLGYHFDYPGRDSRHIWAGTLPGGIAPGTHLLEVRTTDMFGQTYRDHRIIRVR